jgi:hypothetical protein
MNKYVIKIDVKLCLSLAVKYIVQTVKGVLVYLVLFQFNGCTQHDEQCHFADDSENHTVSILSHTTVSFNGISKNDSNTKGLNAIQVVAQSKVCVCEHSLLGIAGLLLVSVVCCQVRDSEAD